MSNHGRPPGVIGPSRPSDRILGSKKVTRQPTGKVVELPGGEQAGLVIQTTQNVCPPPDLCEPGCFEKVKRAPHLDISIE